MVKKAWIAFGIFCVVVVVTALVFMLVSVPQVKSSGVLTGEYNAIARQEYTYSDEKTEQLKHEYTVTSKDVAQGLKNDKYEEGNINPFTPKADVTIYNEPTLKNDVESSGSQLTPDSK